MNYPGINLQFSPAVPADAELLTQFALDSNNIYKYRTVADDEARLIFLLTKDDFAFDSVVCLKVFDELIGFYSLKLPHLLGHLFIEPNKVRRGFGSVLFKKAMSHARTLGWKFIEWESDPNAAIFYQKMGALQIGTKPCRLNPSQILPYFRYPLD